MTSEILNQSHVLLSVESSPAGAESRFRDEIPLKAMKIMVRNLLRGAKLLNKLRSIVRNLLRGERKKFYAT